MRQILNAVFLSLTLVSAPGAQAPLIHPLDAVFADTAVQDALEYLDGLSAQSGARLAALAAIRSPSGQEHRRAAAVAEMMRSIGLSEVRVDETPNAIGVIPGRSGRAMVFISTLDDLLTVAENQDRASSPPRVEGDRVIGPGTNTSATTVGMLAAAEALVRARLVPEHDLVFAAVAQEETGMTGMKQVYSEHRERAIGFVDVLGDGRSISYGGIGIHWWKVLASGPGGHSLGGGLPNVNQGIGRAVDRILGLPQPARTAAARTVVNISILNSGSVFNHKPESGWFSLDIRSLEPKVTAETEQAVRDVLAQVTMETGIGFQMEPYQITPAGQIPGARDSPLVASAAGVSKYLGLEPQLGDAGSSNMNIAVAGGTPAIGLGGSRGGRRGYPDEWADIPTMVRTAKHVLLTAVAMGNARRADK
jgi:acetylornithine deacetylase/succinyl-diaminopimelate desuccinylase-like protein